MRWCEIYYTSIQGVGGHVTHLGLLRTSGLSMHVVPKQACYPFFPCLCRTVKQFPGQSKAINSQNGSCIQVDVWGAFMVHMFEVCWETWSSNYISVRVHCLVGTVKVKKQKQSMDQKLFLHENDQQSSTFFSRILLFLQLYDIVSLQL